MADGGSDDVCDMQLNGVAEVLDLLQLDVETDVVEGKPGREDAAHSVSVQSPCSDPTGHF